MSFTPTAGFTQTTWGVSTSTAAADAYKAAIDGNMIVAQRLGTVFAVQEQMPLASRNMTVHVSAGFLFNGANFSEVAAQDTGTFAVPQTAPRIDRVVADAVTGVVAIVSGSEAVSPSAPTIPAGKVPLARVLLAPGITAIGNSMLTDERAVWVGGKIPGNYQEFTSTGSFTWNKPAGFSTNSIVIALVWGSGAGGSLAAGGGGGACVKGIYRIGDLSTAVAVVVPPGGAASTLSASNAGAQGSFGSLIGYGAGQPVGNFPSGGGGTLSAGTSYAGGGPLPASGYDNDFGGGYGTTASALPGGNSVWGGGGGGAPTASNGIVGGNSIYGGGGGAGGTGSTGSVFSNAAGGTSVYGGNGASSAIPAGAPGGGGCAMNGPGTPLPLPGARGEVRVWTLGG